MFSKFKTTMSQKLKIDGFEIHTAAAPTYRQVPKATAAAFLLRPKMPTFIKAKLI